MQTVVYFFLTIAAISGLFLAAGILGDYVVWLVDHLKGRRPH
jgi:hypothetical protein